MMMNAGAGNRTESPSAPVAGVLTLLDGPGRREKAEMERGLALLGRDLFDGGAVWWILGQSSSVSASRASPLGGWAAGSKGKQIEGGSKEPSQQWSRRGGDKSRSSEEKRGKQWKWKRRSQDFPVDSFGTLVCVRIQPDLPRQTLCTVRSGLSAGCSHLSNISGKLQRTDSVSSQANRWFISQPGSLSVSQTPHRERGLSKTWGQPSLLQSQVNPWVSVSSREHEKCCNSLRVIRGEDAKECARHWITLCWGRGGVYKKPQLGWEPFACNRRGEKPWNIKEYNRFSICLAKQKNNPLPLCFPSYSDINIQIPRLFLMDFFSAQNRLFPESKLC